MKLAQRFFPAAVVNEIIPVGDQIVDRTSGMTEWHAAVHAAGALGAQLLFGEVLVDFEPVVDPLGYRAARRGLPRIFHETRWLTHAGPQPVREPGPIALGYTAGA